VHIAREPGRCIGRDISRGEAIEHELNACIEKRRERRVRDKGTRPVEFLRGLNRSGPTPPVETRSNAEKWLVAYHEGRAAVRLGNTLGTLVAFHQAEAEKYRDRPKGDAA